MKITDANIDLQVHPFLDRNSLIDVVGIMGERNLNAIAPQRYNDNLFPSLLHEARKHYKPEVLIIDRAGVKLPDSKILFNAKEYDTKERLHLLTIGYSVNDVDATTEIRRIIDLALKYSAIPILDHSFADNEKTRTAGHISEEKEQVLEDLCKEYDGQIALEWNSYCALTFIRFGLKLGLNLLGHKTLYHDVNKKTEELSEKLKEEGHNIPIIPTSDVHGRNRRLLKAMGTSRIITNVEGESPSDILESMKKNIFSDDYQSIKKPSNIIESMLYIPHFVEAFGLPILFPNLYEKPRA